MTDYDPDTDPGHPTLEPSPEGLDELREARDQVARWLLGWAVGTADYGECETAANAILRLPLLTAERERAEAWQRAATGADGGSLMESHTALIRERDKARERADELRAEVERLRAIRDAVMECPDDQRRELYRADLIAGQHITRAVIAEQQRDEARERADRLARVVKRVEAMARGAVAAGLVRPSALLAALSATGVDAEAPSAPDPGGGDEL